MRAALRWLLIGFCLVRFYVLYVSIIELSFSVDEQLADAEKPLKNNIAYLADIFNAMNEANKALQGKMIALIRCKDVITAFGFKLSFYKQNWDRCVFYQFPNLRRVLLHNMNG